MKKILLVIQKYTKEIVIGVLLILVFACGTTNGVSQVNRVSQTKVLGVSTVSAPSLTPTSTPIPTTAPITIINNVVLPTTIPTPTSQPITPTPIVVIVTPTPTLMASSISTQPEITPTPTQSEPSPTSTPAAETATVVVDYAGAHVNSTYSVAINSGENAWQVVQNAIGITNLQYTDYGGSLGIFITGFNGVNAAANQYYEFQVNGTSSSVGVSSYIVQDHDVLEFVLTSF